MSETVRSLRKQLAKAEENLRLIQERKAEYVQGVDIPLQLIKDERRLETQIPELRTRLEQLAQARLDADMDRLRAKRDQADKARREMRERQRVVNLRPLDVTHTFKNRAHEMRELCEHLADSSVRFVSVVGRAGMGKTALVSRVLGDLELGVLPVPGGDKDLLIAGILYLNARYTGLTLERIYSDVGRMLGEPAASRLATHWASDAPLTIKVEYLMEAMQDGLYLILLDNLEDELTEDGTIEEEGLHLFVERCLTQPGGSRLIVTSREQIKIAAAALHGARSIYLREGLPEDEAIALLRDLDPQGELRLRDAPEDDLRHAAQLTQGIPRAVEILAGILHADPAASLTELLGDKQLFGEQVVEQLVGEGYRRLGEGERRVMEALAVFDRPVQETAIAYLLHPWFPGLDVRARLRRLARGYFVGINRVTGEYGLHPLDREYAYRQIPDLSCGDEEPIAFHRRNLELRAANFYASIRRGTSDWRSIDDLAPQLAEFEHRIRAGNYDDACQVLDAIDFDYLFLWGHYTRLVEMREKLLGRLEDSSLRATNLLCLGRAYRVLGQVDRAIRLYNEALITAREAGNRWAEEEILGSLGVAYGGLGEYERAIQLHKGALAIAREIGDREGEIRHLGNLGSACNALGNIDQAINLLEEALSIAQRTGDSRGGTMRLLSLGWAYHDLGQVERSIKFYEEALAISRKTGHRLAEWRLLAGLGHAYYDLGQFEVAVKFCEEALIVTRGIGEREGESLCLSELGWTLLAIGELSEAHRNYVDALTLGIPQTSYQQALELGIVLLHRHDQAAGDAFADTITRCRAMLDKTAGLYDLRYALAAALVGQAVCDPRWVDKGGQSRLIAPALAEYHRALDKCSAPGVVRDALCNLEMIRAAHIEGLGPAFELLESTLTNRPREKHNP